MQDSGRRQYGRGLCRNSVSSFPSRLSAGRPFTEALSDVGSQEIHGFVEVTSIGRGDVIQLDSKIFCHQHDVNKVGQVVL